MSNPEKQETSNPLEISPFIGISWQNLAFIISFLAKKV
jgi:hypothetical protein